MPAEKYVPERQPQVELRPILDGLKPPENNLQICYVIPIRGEVANGVFFRQIRSFINQRNADKDTFEILYVRNNPNNDQAIHDQFVPENKTIFESIRFIQGEQERLPEELEQWQSDIIQRAKENKLRVQTIDIDPATLIERTQFGDYIDGSRIVGENLAVKRFEDLGRNGAVVTVDAEHRVGAETTHQIQEQLLGEDNVDMLRIDYDYDRLPGEGGPDLFATSPHQRFKRTVRNMYRVIRGRNIDGWYAVKSQALGTRSTIGYSLAAQRDALLSSSGRVRSSIGIRVVAQDRARSLGVGGDYGNDRQRNMGRYLPEAQVDQLLRRHPAISLLIAIYDTHRDNPVLRTQIVDQLEHYFAGQDWLPKIKAQIEKGDMVIADNYLREPLPADRYAAITYEMIGALSGEKRHELDAAVSEVITTERKKHDRCLGVINRVLDKVYTLDPSLQLTIDDLLIVPGEETEETHFIRSNPWFVKELEYRSGPSSTPEKKMDVLIGRYPEYTKPFDATVYQKANAILLGINHFLEANPRLFVPA